MQDEMTFKIVSREALTVVGIKETITFADNAYIQQTQALWKKFENGGVYDSIRNKSDTRPVIVYFDQGVGGEDLLSLMIGCMVSYDENPELDKTYLPASDYARFSVIGQTMDHVINAWSRIQAFAVEQDTGIAFEVYNHDGETYADRTLDCYVSIK